MNHSSKHVYCSCLTCAIMAEKSKNVTFVNFDIYILDSFKFPKRLRKLDQIDHFFFYFFSFCIFATFIGVLRYFSTFFSSTSTFRNTKAPWTGNTVSIRYNSIKVDKSYKICRNGYKQCCPCLPFVQRYN